MNVVVAIKSVNRMMPYNLVLVGLVQSISMVSCAIEPAKTTHQVTSILTSSSFNRTSIESESAHRGLKNIATGTDSHTSRLAWLM
jgi:hypothetical protein